MPETPHNRPERLHVSSGLNQGPSRPRRKRGAPDESLLSDTGARQEKGENYEVASTANRTNPSAPTSRHVVDGRPERRNGSAADRSATSSQLNRSKMQNESAVTSAYRRDADTYRKRVSADRASKPDASEGRTSREYSNKRPQEGGNSLGHTQSTRDTNAHYNNRERYQQKDARMSGVPWKPALIAAAVIICLAGGGIAYASTRPIPVMLNGTELEVGGSRDVAAIMQEKHAKPAPGDFVAVDGEVLETGQGHTFTAWINGAEVSDPATKLNGGDVIELTDGGNIVEDSDDTVVAVPYEITEEGNGPIHVIEGEGVDGHSTTKVGKVSGKSIVDEAAPVNPVCRKYYPDTGDDKVVALTFDDGPWPGSTEQILDLLDEHDVTATFFTLGDRYDENGKALVKRAFDAGHQICTHSFDHARGDGKGVDLGLMSAEQQIAEITKGYDAIEEATGAEASKAIRTPGGNFNTSVQKNLAPYITAEIGWSIDSEDWRRPGAGTIADSIMGAWPGAIILCHDGGGDRSQTTESLKTALPYLKEQGYRFITIDEMLAYPRKEIA